MQYFFNSLNLKQVFFHQVLYWRMRATMFSWEIVVETFIQPSTFNTVRTAFGQANENSIGHFRSMKLACMIFLPVLITFSKKPVKRDCNISRTRRARQHFSRWLRKSPNTMIKSKWYMPWHQLPTCRMSPAQPFVFFCHL